MCKCCKGLAVIYSPLDRVGCLGGGAGEAEGDAVGPPDGAVVGLNGGGAVDLWGMCCGASVGLRGLGHRLADALAPKEGLWQGSAGQKEITN